MRSSARLRLIPRRFLVEAFHPGGCIASGRSPERQIPTGWKKINQIKSKSDKLNFVFTHTLVPVH